MLRRILFTAGLVGTLAAGLAVAPAASASNVGWSVSIGAPGFAISAGEPYYGRGYYRPYSYYRPYPYYRPHWRPAYVAPRVVYPAPVYYPAPAYVAPGPYYYGPGAYRY